MYKLVGLLIVLVISLFSSSCFFGSYINSASLNGATDGGASLNAVIVNSNISVPFNSVFNFDVELSLPNAASPGTLGQISLSENSEIELVSHDCPAIFAPEQTCLLHARLTVPRGNATFGFQINYQFNAVSYSKHLEAATTGTTSGILVVAKAYPTSGANWGLYVSNTDAGSDRWNQPDITCNFAGAVQLNDCVHGAEHLKIKTGLSDCENLTLSDFLNAFEWQCVVYSGNSYFVTSSLKLNMGLVDLLTAAGWKNNKVVLRENGLVIAESPLETWWQNSIIPLPDNSASPGFPLSNAGSIPTIFFFDSDRTVRTYNVGSNVTIVGLNGAKLIPHTNVTTDNTCQEYFSMMFPNFSCVLNFRGSAGSWFEGNIEYTNAVNPKHAVSLVATKFSRVLNTNLVGSINSTNGVTGYSGIYLYETNQSVIRNIQIASIYRGIYLSAFSEYNFFQKLFFKSLGVGFELSSFCNNNIFNEVVSLNTNVTLDIGTSSDANILGVSQHHGTRSTISTNSSITNLVSMLATNSGLNNINNSLGLSGDKITVSNFFGLHSRDVLRSPTFSINKFSGILGMGNNSVKECWGDVPGSGAGLIDGTCADSFTDGANAYGTSSSNAVLRIGKTAANYFLGRVSTDDSVNSADANGTSSQATIAPAQWNQFENPYRSWGIDSVSTFNLAATGRCTAGTCRIYDFKPLATDTQIINRSGDGVNPNDPFIEKISCPSAVDGNRVTVSLNPIPQTYLTNAFEIMLDGSGDDDGLCESNERCIYMPNIGAYQGHGRILDDPCVFSDGLISGVRLFSFEFNGY
jgi:hypothetical protein